MTQNPFDPTVQAFLAYTSFCMAVWSAFFSNNREEDDEDIIEANEGMLEMVSDGDAVNFIHGVTGNNLRDGLTVQQVLDLHDEATMLKMRGKRN